MNTDQKLEQAFRLLQEVMLERQRKEERVGIIKQEADDMLGGFVPCAEAIKELGISRSTFYKMTKEGKITVHRLTPRKLFVSRQELSSLLNQ